MTNYNRWTCEENEYNNLATLFLNTESATIKSLFHYSKFYIIEKTDLIFFGSVWFIFTVLTTGTWIPAGLFLPGIIMGGAVGRLYTLII